MPVKAQGVAWQQALRACIAPVWRLYAGRASPRSHYLRGWDLL